MSKMHTFLTKLLAHTHNQVIEPVKVLQSEEPKTQIKGNLNTDYANIIHQILSELVDEISLEL